MTAGQGFGPAFGKAVVCLFAVTMIMKAFSPAVASVTPLPVPVLPARVEIQTEAPGLSAEEVENLVTRPLENALVGTPGLDNIRSQSAVGLSSIRIFLRPDAHLERARQFVQERLAVEAPRLPSVSRPPVITPLPASVATPMDEVILPAEVPGADDQGVQPVRYFY